MENKQTPMEALNKLMFSIGTNVSIKQETYYDIVKKELEVLEIIKIKKVNMDLMEFAISNSFNDRHQLSFYNASVAEENRLNEEEFKLIKEWKENDK